MAREVKSEAGDRSLDNINSSSRSMVSKYFSGIKEEVKEDKHIPKLESNDGSNLEGAGVILQRVAHAKSIGAKNNADDGVDGGREKVPEDVLSKGLGNIARSALTRSRSTSGTCVASAFEGVTECISTSHW